MTKAVTVTSPRSSGEFRCARCGYGIIVSGALPTCPMCRTTSWDSSDIRTEGAEMTQDTKTPKDEASTHERSQRDLTASIGTRLVKQEKDNGKRRLFGRRRKPSTEGS